MSSDDDDLDIVQKLRILGREDDYWSAAVCNEAANLIVRLRRELKKLKAK
jgi:hypothetical protein